MIKVSDYPLSILKTYSTHTRFILAKKAIKEQDYKDLEHVLSSMDDDLYSILFKVVDKLDLEAVNLIIARAKNIDKTHYKDGSWISEFHNKSYYTLWIYEGIRINEDPKSIKSFQILKIILSAKTKDTITLKELQKLADSSSKQEFEDFVKSKELDLKDDKFKKLELSQYKFVNLDPLLNLANEESTILNLLLSRTFSDKLILLEIKKMYTDLYNLHPIAREMLAFTASLISKNNSLKILFTKGESSYYSFEQNVIVIQNHFINKKIFNIASVFIHEIGHFIYYQTYKSDAMPFNLVPISKWIKSFEEEHNDEIKDPFMEHSFAHVYFYDLNKIPQMLEQQKVLFAPIMEYEQVARSLVDKAAEMLSVNPQGYSKYIFASEYTEWLKQNSYIDMFFVGSISEYQTERNLDSEVPDHVFDNVLKIYLDEQAKCEINQDTSPLESPFYYPRAEIISWAKNTWLPNYINKANLTLTEVHYIYRIADYVNRGEHLLLEKENTCVDNHTYHEKYAELIVRCMEFRAAGLDSNLTDTCKGLEAFHIKYVSPDICEHIQSSEVVAMPFDVGMVGEVYQCLNLTDKQTCSEVA